MAKQSACKRGHPLIEGNVYDKTDGTRECRTCRRMYKAGVAPPVAFVCGACGVLDMSVVGARTRMVCAPCSEAVKASAPKFATRRKPRHVLINCVMCGREAVKLRRTQRDSGTRTCSQPCAYRLGKIGWACALEDAPERADSPACGWCGGEVPVGRRKYCTRKCSQKGYAKKQHTQCVMCGAALGHWQGKYCTKTCRQEAKRMQELWGGAEIWTQVMAHPGLRDVSALYRQAWQVLDRVRKS